MMCKAGDFSYISIPGKDRNPLSGVSASINNNIISYFNCSILLFCLLPVSAISAGAEIVLNEIYYDHPGPDSGREYVEIYNRADRRINLCGIRIEFADGRTGNCRLFFEFGPNHYIDPRGWVLAGGDSSNTFSPRCVLENGPDAVILKDRELVMDLVGYGDLQLSGLFESVPAPDVEAGLSLSRKPDGEDTDNNMMDFVPAIPSPGSKNFYLRDIGISVSSQRLLPCRGGLLDPCLTVINNGLEPFTGSFELIMEGEDYCKGIRLESLEPGGVFPVEADVAVASSMDSLEFTAFISGDTGENTGNDTVRLSILTSPGSILINEIMYRPRLDSCEWIELFNNSSRKVNIRDWRISDARERDVSITEQDTWISAGSYLILAQDPEKFAEGMESGICSAELNASSENKYKGGLSNGSGLNVMGVDGGWPVLNDYPGYSNKEAVTLLDSSGRVAEQVEYIDLLEGERGRSIERYSPLVCSSAPGGLWHRSASPGGSTPGAVNSVSGGITGFLSITPNPFFINRDRAVEISGKICSGAEGFLVRIFSLSGMEVARVYGEKRGAEHYSSLWNGYDSGGNRVGTGLYICVAEYLSMGGSVVRREKECIAVSSGTF